jgi:hypothetical protein
MRKLLLLFLLLKGVTSFPQLGTVQDTTISNQFEDAILYTQQNLGISSPLYNGIVHIGYAKTIVGIPYYFSPDWVKGTVYFENAIYRQVSLKYDLVADQLIVKRPDGYGINLFSPRVSWFIINDSRFIYIDSKSFNGSLATGFYQQVQEGKVELLYKRSKKINEKITNRLEQQFLDALQFYIIQDGNVREVKGLSSVLNVLNDRRKELKDFIRANKLKYRKDPETVLNKMIAYYNQLH